MPYSSFIVCHVLLSFRKKKLSVSRSYTHKAASSTLNNSLSIKVFVLWDSLSFNKSKQTIDRLNHIKDKSKQTINDLSQCSAVEPGAWWRVSTNDGRSSSLRAIRKTTLSASGRRTDRRAFSLQRRARIEQIRNGKDGSNDLRWNSPMQVKYSSFATSH